MRTVTAITSQLHSRSNHGLRPSLRRSLSTILDQPASPGIVDITIDQKDFRIRLAGTDGHRNSASALVRRMYFWRGYRSRPDIARPNRMSLLMSDRGLTIGTITLQADAACGLSADETFESELDDLRKKGQRLCEMTRLATDEPNYSMLILGSLFHMAYIYARYKFQCTDVVIEVNPRHVEFYRRMLGFEVVGKEIICARVNAPAVLLRLPFEYVERHVRNVTDSVEPGNRSLYHYSFSKQEEEGIRKRLLAFD